MERILHIYAQAFEHGEAFIVGTEESLLALRGAIDQALAANIGECDNFVSDGEGYSTYVIKVVKDEAETLGRPYAEIVHRDMDCRQPEHVYFLLRPPANT